MPAPIMPKGKTLWNWQRKKNLITTGFTCKVLIEIVNVPAVFSAADNTKCDCFMANIQGSLCVSCID